MTEYYFQFQFPRQVLKEVQAINEGPLLKSESGNVRDLRELLWSSIDNVESLDLDQLEYCERGQNREIMVKVAIADVDLFVPKKSRTDEYAAQNGTSVYTGVETFPMLPERLSTDLTSLRVSVDRMAVIVEFVVLSDGNVRKGNIYRALVRNKAKLIYDEIGDWLEEKTAIPSSVHEIAGLEEQLRLQDEAAHRLRKFRIEQGALELDTIEARPVIRDETIAALIVPRTNKARYIIENFMIAANVEMIGFLEKAGIAVIQRVVRTPKNWQGIRDVAAAYSENLPSEPDSKALSQFLIRRKEADPERFPDLSLTIVKLLGPGEYMMLEPGKLSYGHFGLAVADYTHGTAPNRRYVDIIMQRLLKAVLNKRPSPYSKEELAKQSDRCTQRDKASKKVERFMRKAEAAVLLNGRIGESFEAIVTGVSEHGTFVRIISPPVEGRIMWGEEGLTVGQKVNVRLTGMNAYKGHIDFEVQDK
ncbi:MAG: RNB domain-containing ribonuclease [Candidatus Omnitrophota bacterium]